MPACETAAVSELNVDKDGLPRQARDNDQENRTQNKTTAVFSISAVFSPSPGRISKGLNLEQAAAWVVKESAFVLALAARAGDIVLGRSAELDTFVQQPALIDGLSVKQ